MTAAVDVSGLADVCLPSAQKTTQQLGMLSWMGRAAQCAVRWSAVLPGNREPLQLEPEYIPIITKKLTAAVVFLRVESGKSLHAVSELISLQTGIPARRQLLVITETHAPRPGLANRIRQMVHAWRTRSNLCQMALDFISTALLPQAVSREFKGQGFYSWAKGSLHQRMQAATQHANSPVTVHVRRMTGQAEQLTLTSDTSLAELRQLVYNQAGICVESQHITIEEQQAPSMLDQVANQVLLSSCASIRLAGQAAVWASSRLRLMCTASTFPLQVTTTSGHNVTVDARMNMTLTEVQKLSEAAALACSANGSASNDMQGHIQGVSFFTMLSRKIDTSVIWR